MSSIFPSEYVPNEQASTNHKKWEQANPSGDAPKWRAFRDAVVAYETGDTVPIPNMATPHGKALVAAGKLHMSVTDLGSVWTPPDPEPPPITIHRYAARNGSDTNPGSEGAPYLTANKLFNSLQPGEVGAMKAGVYDRVASAMAIGEVTGIVFEKNIVSNTSSYAIWTSDTNGDTQVRDNHSWNLGGVWTSVASGGGR